MQPAERFEVLVGTFLAEPDVTPPTLGAAFGSNGLRVRGRIFAMLTNDRLVVKLPRRRVDDLVAAGEGERFDPRRDGRVMKEWLSLSPTSRQDWTALAREALDFVR
jgi:TfoX/Sxy family transcriptional regulator of competence genes